MPDGEELAEQADERLNHVTRPGLPNASAAQVDGIFIAPIASAPMERRRVATLVAGEGILGDRYAKKAGTYDVIRASCKNPGEREPGRGLTLVSADDVERALNEAGVEPLQSIGDLRRNIAIRGISAIQLLNAVGSKISLGPEVVVFAHRHCPPCMYNEKRNCRPGLMEAVWIEAGINCEVLRGGTLRDGDEVMVLPDSFTPYQIDGGLQSPGFFTRPSERTAEEVREGRLAKQRIYEEALRRGDSEGIRRAEASFTAVGLEFFSKAAKVPPMVDKTHKPEAPAEEPKMNLTPAFLIVFSPLFVILTFLQDWQEWSRAGR